MGAGGNGARDGLIGDITQVWHGETDGVECLVERRQRDPGFDRYPTGDYIG